MQSNDIFAHTQEHVANEKYSKKDLITKSMQSDAEILALLLPWLGLDQTVNNWSQKILSHFYSLPMFFMASPKALQDKLSMSEKDCVTVQLIYAVIQRILYQNIYQFDVIDSKKYLIDYLMVALSREYVEHFILYFLDPQNHIIAEEHHGSGTVNATSVYLQEVARSAIKHSACSVILVHNHPSGIAKPSEADKQLTYQLSDGLSKINVTVQDHLIIGNGCYFSFRENSLLS